MKANQYIPQHNLVNSASIPVAVHYEEWGEVQEHTTLHVHRHNFHEILFFRNGSGVHDIDFTSWKVQPGSVHFVASENVHLLIRDKDSKGCSLMFTQDVCPAELLLKLPFSNACPLLHLTGQQSDMAFAMLSIISQQLSQRADVSDMLVRTQLQALLLFLSGVSAGAGGSAQSTLPPSVVSFRQLVQQHYLQHTTVEEYAALLCISPKHLIDLCKKHIGKTPLQYIREYVVAEAKRLLYSTGMSIKEVAYQLNFDDPGNFSKYFKSICGYAPADYRRGGK